MTDKELIRKVHNGNKEALNTIVERYYDEIYRFCLYLTGQETDSYDITQEVFLRFIKYIDSYEHRNLKGYLLIIARNRRKEVLMRLYKAELYKIIHKKLFVIGVLSHCSFNSWLTPEKTQRCRRR